MTAAFGDDLIRVIAVVELLALTASATYLHHRYRAGLPAPLVAVGRCGGVVLATVVLAVVLNIAAAGPPTPGVYLLAAGSAVPAVALTVAAVCDYRTAGRR